MGKGRQQLEQPGDQSVAQHNGQHVKRMGTGIAGAEHAENDTEGHAVEFRADEIVIAQNEETEQTDIHQHHFVAVSSGEIGDQLRIQQKFRILLRAAAKGNGSQYTAAKEDAAEGIDDDRGSHMQVGNSGGNLHSHNPVQNTLHQKGSHAYGQGSRIDGQALVYVLGILQTGRDGEACGDTHHKGQQNPGQGHVYHLAKGVAHQYFGDERCQTGGQHHQIGVVAQGLFPDQAVDHNTHHGGPDIYNMDAPGTKANGQQGHQYGFMVGLVTGDAVEDRTDQSQKTHIQKGSGISANGKGIGGSEGGILDNANQTGDHVCPVGHEKGSD